MANPSFLGHQYPSSSNPTRKTSQEKKKCELCESQATISCESDQAILCWNCDSKIHSANFLVAKHTRVLLCHFCQSLTPWTGSGPRLTPSITCCELCKNGEEEEEEEEEEDEEEDQEDDDEKNQVVPGVAASYSSDTSLRGDSQVSDFSASNQEWSSRLGAYQGAFMSGRGLH